MGLRNTETEYGSIAKWFHWVTALLIITLLCVGWLMDKADPSLKGIIYNTHKLVGLLVLFITIPRLLWALSGIKPTLPATLKPWEKIAERLVHSGIYLSLFLMPLFGWAMSTAAGRAPKLFTLSLAMPGIAQDKALAHLFAGYHELFAWIIVVLVSVHASAALKHHFIDKDNVLRSMLPRHK